jgi:hypothetical protein
MEPIEIEIPQTENQATPTSSFNLSFLKDLTDRFMALSSRDKLYAFGGALFLVGVIAVCAAGGTTCSSVTVINQLDTTLYISRLSPYTAYFNDANKNKPHNHPIWNDESFAERGDVSVSFGAGDKIDMRVDKYYTFNDDYFYLHLFSDQAKKPYVSGNDKVHIEQEKGFWGCYAYLKEGAPASNSNTTAVTQYLRG